MGPGFLFPFEFGIILLHAIVLLHFVFCVVHRTVYSWSFGPLYTFSAPAIAICIVHLNVWLSSLLLIVV